LEGSEIVRTLESVYDEVLGLMFSNNTGSSKVTTEDASVSEYMFNMHHAFNAGLDDLYSSVVDAREFVFIAGATEGGIYAIKTYLKDDMKNRYICATDDVFIKKDEKYKRTILYDYLMKDVISFGKDGDFAVAVKVKPLTVSENTDKETKIDIEDNIISALVYYMAYRLYLEDDASIATSYLNIYEAKKEALYELYGEKGGSKGQEFESSRGWY
jgi:hypothetical protein